MFAGASLDENSGAFCELKANFFRLILTKAELLALTPADFDFQKQTVTISKTFHRSKGRDIITSPKTKKSNRTIKMPPFLCEEIREYIKMLYDIQPDERLFTVTKSYLNHEMERGAKQAGVKKIRVHDIRHTHATVFLLFFHLFALDFTNLLWCFNRFSCTYSLNYTQISIECGFVVSLA